MRLYRRLPIGGRLTTFRIHDAPTIEPNYVPVAHPPPLTASGSPDHSTDQHHMILHFLGLTETKSRSRMKPTLLMICPTSTPMRRNEQLEEQRVWAHRDHLRSGTTEIQLARDTVRAAPQRHPAGHPQAVFSRRKDPDRPRRPAWQGVNRRALPAGRHWREPLLQLIEGGPGSRQAPTGRRHGAVDVSHYPTRDRCESRFRLRVDDVDHRTAHSRCIGMFIGNCPSNETA